MAVGLTTGFVPKNNSPGLHITISAGHAVISGAVAYFPPGDIALAANSTTYIYLNYSSGHIESSLSGFLANSWPICIARTTATDCNGYDDLRPDAPLQGGGGGSPGGLNKSIQFNNSGSLGGDSNLTWDTSAQLLNLIPGNGGYASLGTINGSNDNLINPATPSVLTIEYPDTGTQADIVELHSHYGIGMSIFAHSSLSFQEPQITFYRSHGTRTSPTATIYSTR